MPRFRFKGLSNAITREALPDRLRAYINGTLLLVLGCALLGMVAGAQTAPNPNTDVGLTPFAPTHGGNLDSVNLSNGNLNLHIPLISYPQRGKDLSLDFFIRYNNKAYIGFPYPVQGVQTFRWLWRGNGVEVVRGGVLGLQDNSQSVPIPNCPGGPDNCNPMVVEMLGAMAPDGGSHLLGGLCTDMTCPTGANFGDAIALDASGTHYFAPCPTAQSPTPPVVVEANGVRHIQQPRSYSTVQGACPSLVATPGYWAYDLLNGTPHQNFDGYFVNSTVDPNGNAISVTSSGWLDTLGRLIPGSAPTTGDYGATNKYEMILPGIATSDFSNCPAPTASARIWNLPGPNSGSSPVKLCYSNVALSTNFHTPYPCDGTCFYTEWNFTVRLLTAVVLPDLSFWKFDYNSYGDLAKVTFPTGGSISYTWINYSWPTSDINTPVSRTVSSRTVDANDGTGGQKWTYQWGIPAFSDVTVTDPLGNDTVHIFSSVVGPEALYETETKFYQGSSTSGTLMKTVDTQYSGSPNPFDIYDFPVRWSDRVTATNVVPTTVTTTWANGMKSESTHAYDSGTTYNAFDNRQGTYGAWNSYTAIYGSETRTDGYDFGNGSVGGLLRSTRTSYQWQSNTNYLNANMLSLPASMAVFNGNSCKMSETDYTYDESNYLTTYSGTLPQGTHGPPPNSVRGNATSVSHQLFLGTTCPTSSQTGPVSHTNWYDTGVVFKGIDPLGNTTTHSYDPAYGGAYSTSTCNALSQCVSGTYDFNTGLLTSFTDANGNGAGDPAHTSNYSYDNMLRMTLARLPPDPSGHRPQTSFSYPNSTEIDKSSTVTASLNDQSSTFFDGLGRTAKVLHSSAGNATVVTTYDALGRASSVTNPYFSTSDPTYGITQTQYDALGRPIQVTKQDGSLVVTQYDQTSANSSNGNCIIATDEAGKPRKSCVDGLGRLIEVDEPQSTAIGTNSTASVTIGGGVESVITGTVVPVSPGSQLLMFNPDSIAYVGTDGGIYQPWGVPLSSTWHMGGLASAGAAASNSPLVGYYTDTFNSPSTNTEGVYYVGTDQHLHAAWYSYSAGTITNKDLTAVGGANVGSGSQLVMFNPDNIAYIGTDGGIYQPWGVPLSSAWHMGGLASAGAAASNSPLVGYYTDTYNSPSTNTAGVYYVGADQHLHASWYSYSAGTITNKDLTAVGGANVGSGSQLVMFNPDNIAYIGTDGGIYQPWGVPLSSTWHMGGLASAGAAASNSPLVGYSTDTYNSPSTDTAGIYYVGTDQHLHASWYQYNTGQLISSDLSVLAVSTFDAGITSLTVGGFTATACFGATTNPACVNQPVNTTSGQVASALANAINAPASPATATVSGSTINLTWKVPGPFSPAVSSLSATHDNPGLFPNPSFTTQATSFSGGTDNFGSTPYITLYSHDILGNLLSVNQRGDGGQAARVRTFAYDSLSRLLTATNPESGTISYSYDANNNLLQKTSPAPNQTGSATQTISYCYDALNRVTGKAYSAQSCPLTSPVVAYTYDSGTNGIGHLTSLADQAGSASYSYDVLGRIASENRTIAGIQKNLAYTYNLDSSIAALTYPSAAVVTYTPDSAGRMVSAVDSGNNINYVTSATYGPDNGLTGFVSANNTSFAGITSNFSYNKRLQPITISASSPTATVFSIGYDFHLGNGDNGNVFGITNNRDTTRNQTFTYDALNRLTSAQNAGTDCSQSTVNDRTKFWGNSYGYDAWGNLLQKMPTKCSAENLSVSVLSNNQLVGYGYDAAGNMTHDATTVNNYSYDQENRITGAAGFTYTYDADGNRVEKSNGSTGTIYWYMTPGIVAESDLTGALKSEYFFFDGERVARKDFPGNSVFYYFSDHLKTASVITDSAGTIKEDEDYYPWGGELQFVNNDSNHYKFTSKERDSETGLDYFGARYYGNWLGRFITPDWSATPVPVPYADLGDPQSLNQYSYVRNVPTSRADVDGHKCTTDENGNSHCIVREPVGDDCNQDCQALFHSPEAQQIWANSAGFGDAIAYPLLTFVQISATAGLSEVFVPTPPLGTLGKVEPVAPSPSRLPQDVNVNPTPPKPNNGNGTVGPSPTQNAAAKADAAEAQAAGHTDIRMNQQQVNAKGQRVGINRPDLQSTDPNGLRHYTEYDRNPDSAAAHEQRTTTNDPNGVTHTKILD